MCRKWIHAMFEISGTLAVAYAVGRWAVHYAYMERGYKAIGGEYLFIPMVGWVTYNAIHWFLLRGEKYADKWGGKKGRGRTDTGL